ncbi:type IV pilin [Natronobacterium haloterrestre]|uniref:type IV pilin n=1 Tax=Natronobacterium haloterrestre TaxID=148448 RepID=UPI000B7D8094|nr:type IV pilin N-terminal domain-containing protein [Halobiforma haloterrestris]
MFDGSKIRDKLVGSDEERAVSPVIGVILMVAITVILAAVIAAFVLDLGDLSESANAGVEFDESGSEVTVRIIDEGNTDSIYVEAHEGSDSEWVDTSGSQSNDETAWTVGDSATLDSDSPSIGGDISSSIDEIIIYGEVDGEKQVIQTWEP